MFQQLQKLLRKTALLLFLLVAYGCTLSSLWEHKIARRIDIKKFVASLPSGERFLLDLFFRRLIQEDAIGYTLLGGKPMSFYCYLQPKTIVTSYQSKPLPCIDRLDLFFEGFDVEHALFHKGLEIWKKYEHHFCGRNIFFDVFEQDQELRFTQISVFNKRLMLSFFDRYPHKFRNLDCSIKDKNRYFDLFLKNERFKKKFYSQQDLLGVCLGFGARNAELFQKMVNLLTSMGKLRFTLKKPSIDHLKSLEEEWSSLEKVFKIGFKDHVTRKFLFNIGLGFRVDFSDPETARLQKKYTGLYKELRHTYEGSTFLEKTLELISLEDNAKF
jgi:hypothetical protein